MNEFELSQDSLRTLAEETGGIASVNSNSLTTAFERIVRSEQPLLRARLLPSHASARRTVPQDRGAREPAGTPSAGTTRLRVSRGRTVEERKRDEEARRARDARRPDADKTSAQLRDVLFSPMQQSGLNVHRAGGAVQEHTQGSVGRARDRARRQRLPFAPPERERPCSRTKSSCRSSASTIRARRWRGTRTELDLTLRPETRDRVTANGVRVNPRINLAPGRYQVRIGARERARRTQWHGVLRPRRARLPQREADDRRVAADDGVEFSRRPAFSPIRLSRNCCRPPPRAGARSRGATPRVVHGDLRQHLRPPAAAHRRRGAPAFGGRQRGVRQPATSWPTARRSGQPGAGGKPWEIYGYAKQIPLKDVPPGRYLLRVEAQVRGNSTMQSRLARETLITVHPVESAACPSGAESRQSTRILASDVST